MSTADVISLAAHRRDHKPTCQCREGFTCYSHRLVDLAARIEDIRSDVEPFRFCDWNTFDRLTSEVLTVLDAIVAETLPSEAVRDA